MPVCFEPLPNRNCWWRSFRSSVEQKVCVVAWCPSLQSTLLCLSVCAVLKCDSRGHLASDNFVWARPHYVNVPKRDKSDFFMLNRLGTTTHEQTSSWWWLNGLYSVETSLSGSNGFFFGAISHLLSTIGTELRRDGATISFDRLQTLDSAFLSFLCRAKEKELLQWLFRALHYFKGFCFVLAPSVT